MNNQFTNPPPESPTRKQHHVDQVGGGAQPLTTPPMTPTMGAAMAAIPPAADPQTPLKTRSRTVSAHSWPPPASPAIGLPNRYTNTSEPRVLVGSAAEDNVRALATELGQSMFRNVSASRASIFLDPVVSGRFVSMPHIGASTGPDANALMRLVEETLRPGIGLLTTPTATVDSLQSFGSMIMDRILEDTHATNYLSHALATVRLGKTSSDATEDMATDPTLKALSDEFPLFLEVNIMVARAAAVMSASSSPSKAQLGSSGNAVAAAAAAAAAKTQDPTTAAITSNPGTDAHIGILLESTSCPAAYLICERTI